MPERRRKGEKANFADYTGNSLPSQRLLNNPKKVRSLIYDQIPTIRWKFDENRSSRSWDNLSQSQVNMNHRAQVLLIILTACISFSHQHVSRNMCNYVIEDIHIPCLLVCCYCTKTRSSIDVCLNIATTRSQQPTVRLLWRHRTIEARSQPGNLHWQWYVNEDPWIANRVQLLRCFTPD